MISVLRFDRITWPPRQ